MRYYGTPWKYSVKLRDLLTDEDTPEAVERVARAFYKRLQPLAKRLNEEEFDDHMENLLIFIECENFDVDEFNDWLEYAWDLFDYYRVWVKW